MSSSGASPSGFNRVAVVASGVWIALLGLGMLSVVRAFWFSPEFAAGDATRTWPTAPGEVLIADPERVPPASGSLAGPDFDFLQYRYTVNGVTYTNNRLQWVYTYHANETARQFAQRWAARFPAGTNVTVYHSPTDPKLAVLEPGADRSGAATAGLALCAFLAAVALVGLYFIHAAAVFWGRRRAGG